mmetsp:Transcript_17635/g.59129  ORF Transcript_17635/g.59129 Transcript_17635/m.59129 type:complete len:262 (-) Transcript_17635:164-949(-)
MARLARPRPAWRPRRGARGPAGRRARRRRSKRSASRCRRPPASSRQPECPRQAPAGEAPDPTQSPPPHGRRVASDPRRRRGTALAVPVAFTMPLASHWLRGEPTRAPIDALDTNTTARRQETGAGRACHHPTTEAACWGATRANTRRPTQPMHRPPGGDDPEHVPEPRGASSRPSSRGSLTFPYAVCAHLLESHTSSLFVSLPLQIPIDSLAHSLWGSGMIARVRLIYLRREPADISTASGQRANGNASPCRTARHHLCGR